MQLQPALHHPGRAAALPPLSATSLPWTQTPAYRYLDQLSSTSRQTMHQALDTIAALLTGGRATARTLSWPSVRVQHTTALRARLAHRYAPSTANKLLVALRGVLKTAWRLGLLDAEAYLRAIDLPPVRGAAQARGRVLSPKELGALFAACAADPSPAGRRDAALLALLTGAGLRRAELVALQLSDLKAMAKDLSLRVGRGSSARRVRLDPRAEQVLLAWIQRRGLEPGPLFYPINKAGRLVLRAMTDRAVYLRLRTRSQQARIWACSPEDLRRSYRAGRRLPREARGTGRW